MRRLALLALLVPLAAGAKDPVISWEKVVLDDKFRAEGVAVADVNKDGKNDILVGEFWYEAPTWARHEMQKPGDYGDGLKGYSKVFACWADDFNADGYPDLLVVGFPGEPAYWLENPKGKPTHWAKHEVWPSACNETPVYADLLGAGKRGLLMGAQPAGKGNQGEMAFFTPDPTDPNAKWLKTSISGPSSPGKEVPGTQRFSHGLGVGDINGDGRRDVICTGGWWEQPASQTGGPWVFHPADLGPSCADMFAADVDGDGKADVLSTSAHQFGVWWHKQRAGGFDRKDLFKDLISETHAAHFVDLDGDGLADLVTGKRWWSHGKSEPGSDKPAALYWLKAAKGADGMTTFTPAVIDADSGIGTQFAVTDVDGDGLLDIVTANKKGVRVVFQRRK